MKLTVFGEILWDLFEDEQKIGGAPFNFAAQAAMEGADVAFISAVGEDALGDAALKECRRLNIPTDHISRVAYPTGTCTVTLENGTPVYDLSGDMAYDHIVIPKDLDSGDHKPSAFYFGTLAQRSEESRTALHQFLKNNKDSFDEIFLDINIRQDYFTQDVLDRSFKAATILKISRDDIAALGFSGTPEEFCRDLAAQYPDIKLMVVTLDSDGAFVYDKGSDYPFHYSDRPDCKVVSTVGAGDAFSAAFLVNYLAGRSIDVCLFRASSLAGFVCEHLEAVPSYPMDDIRNWKAIYRLLDMVNVEVFDCGTLCGNACCMCRGSSGDMGIYLYPGEHLLLRESEKEYPWLTWEEQDPEDIDFPPSWRGPVYFVKCSDPPECPRKWRPLQCRSFPLKPVIGDTGVLELIWEDDDLPYSCPIIEKNMPIHDSFYKATYTVWSHLLRDKRIFDLILGWS